MLLTLKDPTDEIIGFKFVTVRQRDIVIKSLTPYIVGCQGASQLGGSLLGIQPGYLHEVS